MTSDGDPDHDLSITSGDLANGDMVCVLDTEQICVSVNGPFLDAFDMQEEDLVGKPACDAAGAACLAGLVEDGIAAALAGESASTQRWWDFPCLGFRYVRIGLAPLRDEAGAVKGAAVCVRDLTETRLAHEALAESEQRFEDFAGLVGECFWELDAALRFVYVSARFEEIMGMPRDRVLGRRRIEVFPGEDHAAPDTRSHHRDLGERRPFDDYRFTRVLGDGTQRNIRMSGRPVFDSNGGFQGYRVVAADVSDRRRTESRIAHIATHDALTGLVNRQEFLQRLRRIVETASCGESEHGLAYVDVDRFRTINDRYGHAAGDQLLVELAELLREQIRRRDTLARVGGNAFAILMEHCSLARIERVADSVHRAIGAFHFLRADETINVSVSVGVVPIGGASRSIDRVLRAADRACYAAKSAGGDRILVYGRSDTRAVRERRRNELAAADP